MPIWLFRSLFLQFHRRQEFTVDEAAEIVFEGVIPQAREMPLMFWAPSGSSDLPSLMKLPISFEGLIPYAQRHAASWVSNLGNSGTRNQAGMRSSLPRPRKTARWRKALVPAGAPRPRVRYS
jgi:hypothetical protein